MVLWGASQVHKLRGRRPHTRAAFGRGSGLALKPAFLTLGRRTANFSALALVLKVRVPAMTNPP